MCSYPLSLRAVLFLGFSSSVLRESRLLSLAGWSPSIVLFRRVHGTGAVTTQKVEDWENLLSDSPYFDRCYLLRGCLSCEAVNPFGFEDRVPLEGLLQIG